VVSTVEQMQGSESMSRVAATQWWQNSLNEMGVQGMEKLLPRDASWEQVLQSGRDDFALGLRISQMQTGKDRSAVEIGCGVGRVTQALGEHFGRVVGLDVAPSLIEQARAKNVSDHVSFQVSDGDRILPQGVTPGEVDTVFSYEVLYIVDPKTLQRYFHDVAALLSPGGEFVFQMNVEPLAWKTRASYVVRQALWLCGVKSWRGWPTGPGFRRYAYTKPGVCRMVADAGLQVLRVAGESPRQAWFVARKPTP
jgi:predicted TPR repeat methyltransferase